MTRNLSIKLSAAAFAAALCLTAGCSHEQETDAMIFGPTDRPRPSELLNQRQADLGARRDATLHPVHFDGPTLNSLGEDALLRMVRGAGEFGRLTIYLDLPETEREARIDDVDAYLKTMPLNFDRVTIKTGQSEDTTPYAKIAGGYGSGGGDNQLGNGVTEIANDPAAGLATDNDTGTGDATARAAH
jgi:hypothetical protein